MAKANSSTRNSQTSSASLKIGEDVVAPAATP